MNSGRINPLKLVADRFYAEHPELDPTLTSLEFGRSPGGFWRVKGWIQLEPKSAAGPYDEFMEFPCGARMELKLPDGLVTLDRVFDTFEARHGDLCACNRRGDDEGPAG